MLEGLVEFDRRSTRSRMKKIIRKDVIGYSECCNECSKNESERFTPIEGYPPGTEFCAGCGDSYKNPIAQHQQENKITVIRFFQTIWDGLLQCGILGSMVTGSDSLSFVYLMDINMR